MARDKSASLVVSMPHKDLARRCDHEFVGGGGQGVDGGREIRQRRAVLSGGYGAPPVLVGAMRVAVGELWQKKT